MSPSKHVVDTLVPSKTDTSSLVEIVRNSIRIDPLPLGCDQVPVPPRLPAGTLHAWSSLVLPFLEQSGFAGRIDHGRFWNAAGGNDVASRRRIAAYNCPSALLAHIGKADYGGVSGAWMLGVDGVWHARGSALDSAWSAQLNPFLTLATLEWRLGMQRREFHDAAMRRVRAFVSADREAGLRVLDAGAGVVAEAVEMPIGEVLRRHAVVRKPLPLPRRAHLPRVEVEMPAPRRSRGIVAVVVADSEHGGTGVNRHLDSEFGGRPVLTRTVERVASASCVERVIVITDAPAAMAPLVAAAQARVPVEIEGCSGALRGPESAAIAARLWRVCPPMVLNPPPA
jgi:hypothetical protein